MNAAWKELVEDYTKIYETGIDDESNAGDDEPITVAVIGALLLHEDRLRKAIPFPGFWGTTGDGGFCIEQHLFDDSVTICRIAPDGTCRLSRFQRTKRTQPVEIF
jgi:hypothetical protein